MTSELTEREREREREREIVLCLLLIPTLVYVVSVANVLISMVVSYYVMLFVPVKKNFFVNVLFSLFSFYLVPPERHHSLTYL